MGTVDRHLEAVAGAQLRGFGYETFANPAALPGTGVDGEIVYVTSLAAHRYWNGTEWKAWDGTEFTGSIVGDNSTTTFAVVHNLGLTNGVFRSFTLVKANGDQVDADVRNSIANSLNVLFAVAPTVSDTYHYKVVA